MAVRNNARGLSPEELAHIRGALAAGRRPKVIFTQAAGQIAGQHGQVVELGDPERSEEWVVVRFGRDELPFSPTDLAMAPKGAAPRRAAKVTSRSPATAPVAPGAPLLPPAEPSVAKPAAAPPPVAAAAPAGGDRTAQAAGRSAAEGGARPGRPAAKAAARKAGRGRQPSALTVTVTYADGEWTVAAHQGGKVLAKPYLIKAAEALKMVGMLDVPGVQEAVEEIVAADRAEAEATAERLRAELAEVEARLAELRGTS
ncbi:hypothetical protein HC031_20695 [Planosporangium thailandense]|uniref:Translation initiation factor n=1 Tax=Planosporangium thailandense TaxID=765197 RepID=A0ABX0Y1Z7_9ACTN|nr:hypothetical protein [Planosporangium thailandense]NJC72116.1 hypothetical protein [Planosporangium thailandense]